jgi:NAD(P)-dependent dehydrogenase (short-subunit alcohol dehydrogenase family)
VPGSIINIASITAHRPQLMTTAYCVSKAGVEHLTKQMALENARYGVRVNAIAPGYFKTDINDQYLDSDAGDAMRKRIAMRRFGEYGELDGALLLLASDAGSYMTGSSLVVDGGHLLSPL